MTKKDWKETRRLILTVLSLMVILLLMAGCTIGENNSVAGIAVNSKVLKDETFTADGEGTSYGFYYSIWHQNGGSLSFKTFSAAPGKYDFTWTNTETVAGLGWNDWSSANRNPNHTISYSVELYQNNGSGGLSLYGWTRNPLIEYYVTEKGDFGGTNVNTITSDGNTYQVRKNQRIQQPSIDGTQTFWQFIDIKQNQPSSITGTSGTITIKNHFDNWAANGMALGTNYYYQIMAAEGFGAGGSGHAIVTVREGAATKTWQTIGTRPNNTVNTIAFNSNNMYIGGDFTTVGGINASRIAKYSNGAWSALGSGTNGLVQKIIFGGSNMYVSGSFTQAGGITANRIAKYSNGTWSTLGSGMNMAVSEMAYGNNTLYAGGMFTTAGGVTVKSIAKWNGSAWSAVGTFGAGVNGNVAIDSLVCDTSGNLYVGWTDFSTLSGIRKVSKWNGSAWSDLGTFNSRVETLVYSGSTLYSGGWFTKAGNTTTNRIAKWNGSNWSALGTGTNNDVWALTCDTYGNLYAGGMFTTAGGITVNRIAKWNGSAWSAIGSGLDSYVRALAADSNGNLYAGGDFFSHLLVYK